MLSHQRSEYIPIVGVTMGPQTIQQLDELSALYVGMKTDITTYTKYMVNDTTAGRPELISDMFYRTVELWWVVCYYNDVIFPLTEIKAGVELMIPDYMQLNFFLQKLESQKSRQGQTIEV